MSDFGTLTLDAEVRDIIAEKPYLGDYLEDFKKEFGEYPSYIDAPSDEWESRFPNVLYRTGDSTFVHIHGDAGLSTRYIVIEPPLDEDEEDLLDVIKLRLLEIASDYEQPETDAEMEEYLDTLLDDVVVTEKKTFSIGDRFRKFMGKQVALDSETFERIRYYIHRDIAGIGALDPIMKDPENEDIHVIGSDGCHVDHGTYGMLPTTISFGESFEYDNWLKNIGERMGSPISDADPIIDSTLPDGSRINIVYSDDISIEGSSLTIRQGAEVPLSIMQITKWGTLSPRLAAYLWLCLENERTVFVVGETASGKTTTLNALLSFIPFTSKIYTAEDTAEVQVPHETWQRLITRESPEDDSSTDVDLFDLVASALRSRPDYIIVGEVRGPEAQMAFQAAQTGHPVMLTFHASNVRSMIQRMTGNPINVPETFLDNCDVALFQNRVERDGELLRRVTSVAEIEGYSEVDGGVLTREVFEWDSVEDEINFNGMNNSYVLEEKVADLLGYKDKRDIYNELERRTRIIEQLIESDVLEYAEVNDALETFRRDGVEALPIDLSKI